MKPAVKLIIVVSLASAAGLAMVVRAERGGSARSQPRADGPAATPAPVPRLVDLGARKCIPCKAMAPILVQLRADYAGRLEVTFIDVWQNPDEAGAYRIQLIPTQIFYAADGRELARHEGFISREDILAPWKPLGVEL